MLSASAAKFMATKSAKIVQEREKYFIEFALSDGAVRIPLSDERPKEVKAAFNKIISEIKLAEFTIEFEMPGDDLFSQVAKEYISHLNREIHEVRAEMAQLGLLPTARPRAMDENF